jgi:hypothetical protein
MLKAKLEKRHGDHRLAVSNGKSPRVALFS